jgi:hypothetical protein
VDIEQHKLETSGVQERRRIQPNLANFVVCIRPERKSDIFAPSARYHLIKEDASRCTTP